ncbi:MAG: low specificity L-threonine aldolase [Armatimonadota bacterium]
MPLPGTNLIDLRSDTKTMPDEEMRRAMAEAEVGDDVAGEDPTVNRLEEMAAQRLGKEAALFVVSGTMGNLLGMKTHTQPGQEIVLETWAHVYRYEASGLAAFCGLLPRPVTGVHGRMDPAQVAAAISDGSNVHQARTGLLALENTHNVAGGTVLTVEQTEALCAVAHERKVPVHLDGARIFNAAVALGVDVAELVAPVDSVQFCFSKSLGAPVGSMLCGTAEYIARARRYRKMIGGGMRQAGVIAAAAIVALERSPQRLHEDHANARKIAETLAELPGIHVDLETVQTNIVNLEVRREDIDAPGLCRALGDEDILATSRDAVRIRLVTHVQVTAEDTERVCAALRRILG